MNRRNFFLTAPLGAAAVAAGNVSPDVTSQLLKVLKADRGPIIKPEEARSIIVNSVVRTVQKA